MPILLKGKLRQSSLVPCPGHIGSEQQSRGSKASCLVARTPALKFPLCYSLPTTTWISRIAGIEQKHGWFFNVVQLQRFKLDVWIEWTATGDCNKFTLLNCCEPTGIWDFKDLKICLVGGRMTVSEEIHRCRWLRIVIYFFKFLLFIYLFFGCVWFLLLCAGFL